MSGRRHRAVCLAGLLLACSGGVRAERLPIVSYTTADGLAMAFRAGLTVAVVAAYDLPTAEADLHNYRAQYGLPDCSDSCSGW